MVSSDYGLECEEVSTKVLIQYYSSCYQGGDSSDLDDFTLIYLMNFERPNISAIRLLYICNTYNHAFNSGIFTKLLVSVSIPKF